MTILVFIAALAAPMQKCAPTYGPDPDDDIQPHLYSELIERVSLKDDETEIFTFLDSGDCGLKNNSHPVVSDDGNRIVFATRSQAVLEGSNNRQELLQIYLRDVAAGRTYLISGKAPAGDGPGMEQVGNADSDFPHLSGNGQWIVWGSDATDLPGNDNGAGAPQVRDVFIHEVDAGQTTRLESLAGQAPNGDTYEPFVSHNGRRICFTSRATNLVGGIGSQGSPNCPTAKPDGKANIFLYDRGTPDQQPATLPSIQWVSVGVSPQGCPESPDAPCTKPSMSAKGCFVVFESAANNLTEENTGGVKQIFLRNTITGKTKLVSRSVTGQGGNDVSRNAQISRDGRWVVFASAASDLLAPGFDTNGIGDAFVWERTSGSIRRVSVYSDGTQITSTTPPRNTFIYPHISGSGRFVFFTSAIDEFNSPGAPADANSSELYVHDRDYDTDGLFDEDFGSDGVRTIRLSDLPSATDAGLRSNGWAGGNCWATNDGRYVVFMASASDFVDANDVGGADTNGNAEPQDATCCGGSAPCEPNPGDTGRDVFRRTVWGGGP